VLQRNSRDLSTFERYSQEVMSGQLKWGPVHTEKFWREQARKFEADEFFILKQVSASRADRGVFVVGVLADG
ncbi:unnamed protein product, partial [Hapterophycus canaliculatus]